MTNFALICTDFSPSLVEKFEAMLDQFFEDKMCDGRSQACYDMRMFPKNTIIEFKRPPRKKRAPKLFIGNEETNMGDFISPCCKALLSLEPLCNVCCGSCGKPVAHENAVYRPAK